MLLSSWFTRRFSLLKLPHGFPGKEAASVCVGQGLEGLGTLPVPPAPWDGAEALLSSLWMARLSRRPLPRSLECGVTLACPGSRGLACRAPGTPVSVGPGGQDL